MSSEQDSAPKQTPKPKSKSGLLRLLIALVIGGVVLVVGGAFILTSSWFITGTVLPMVGNAIGSTVEAKQVSGITSSQLEVSDFSLTPNNETRLVAIKRLGVNYNLREIIGGRIVASDIDVEGVDLELVVKPDGSLSIDPILEALSGPEPEESAPLQLQVTGIKISDSSLRVRLQGAASEEALYEVTELQLGVDRVENGQPAELTVSGKVNVTMTSGGVTNRLTATLTESTTVSLSDELLPSSFETALSLLINSAEGAFAEFADDQIQLSGKLAENRLESLRLEVAKSGQALGRLEVSGPFDLEGGTADLEIALSGIDQNLLNQFTEVVGFGFGTPQVSATGGVKIAGGGQSLVFDLSARGENVVLQAGQAKSPRLDFAVNLGAGVDLDQSMLRLERANVEAKANGQPMVTVTSQKPLKISFGDSGMGVSDAAIDLNVSNFQFGDWSVLLGEGATGRVDSKLSLTSEGSQGETVRAVGEIRMANLVSANAEGPSAGLGLVSKFEATVTELQALDVPEVTFSATNTRGKLADGKASLSYSKSGVVALDSQVSVASLFNPSGKELALGMSVAGTVGATETKLEAVKLTLPNTEKVSANQVVLSGTLSPSDPEGLSGQLRLESDSLDVTPLWDFVSAPSAATKDSEPSQPESSPNVEPEPIELPVNRLMATLQFDQLFAREIVISNWLADAVVEKSRLQAEPLKLVLNGSPVEGHAKIGLDVPGYTYDLGLQTAGVPASPFIASFVPSLNGVFGSTIDLGVAIQGAGTTGANLKQNLAGNADFSFKGGNIELFDSWKRFFLTPVALVLRIPSLLESPIQGVELNSKFGDGAVELANFEVLSPEFEVQSSGSIPIADDLMASALSLPVSVKLKKEVAVSSNLVDEDAEASETGYVALPKFVSVAGNVGVPEVKIDKVAVGKLFIRNVAGLPESVVGEAGDALKGLGDLVGGKGDQKNAAGKLLEGVGGLIGGESGAGLKDAGSALRGLFNRGNKADETPKQE